MSATRPPRVLMLFNEIKIGTSIASIPALTAVMRHFGPEAEFWLLCREKDGARTMLLDIPFATGKIAGYLATPSWRNIPALLATILRLWRLGFRRAVYLGNPTFGQRSLNRFRLLLAAGGIFSQIGFRRCCSRRREDAVTGEISCLDNQLALRLENLTRYGIAAAGDAHVAPPLFTVPDSIGHHALTWLQANRRLPERPLVAICPGAASAANHWPIDRFVEIGRRLLALDRFEVVVCGGAGERESGDQMVTQWRAGINAAGQLPVLGSAAIFRECAFMIGLDTGTTHLAAAMGTPCVVLQGGRMLAGAWDPPGSGHIIIRHRVNCAGCGRSVCPTHRHPCMKGVTVDRVWQAMLRFPPVGETLPRLTNDGSHGTPRA